MMTGNNKPLTRKGFTRQALLLHATGLGLVIAILWLDELLYLPHLLLGAAPHGGQLARERIRVVYCRSHCGPDLCMDATGTEKDSVPKGIPRSLRGLQQTPHA